MHLFKNQTSLAYSSILSLLLVACSDVEILLATEALPPTIEVLSSSNKTTSEALPSSNNSTQAAELEISGGSPSLPVDLNLSKSHAISSDLSTNYFKHAAVAKEKWVIRAALNKPLNLAKKAFCRSESNSFISIYTEDFVLLNKRSCAVDLTHEFVESGTYILHISYPVDYSGSFSVASALLRFHE
jgi:hypothetical protein